MRPAWNSQNPKEISLSRMSPLRHQIPRFLLLKGWILRFLLVKYSALSDPVDQGNPHWLDYSWVYGLLQSVQFDWMEPMCINGTKTNWAPILAISHRISNYLAGLFRKILHALVKLMRRKLFWLLNEQVFTK